LKASSKESAESKSWWCELATPHRHVTMGAGGFDSAAAHGHALRRN